MDRADVFAYCKEQFNTQPDYPWDGDETAVLRHADNRKWFALVMNLPKSKFGLPTADRTDVMNLKLPPEMIGSFGPSDGIYPAYHMNKASWVSVLLDTADADTVKFLLGVSFSVTESRLKLKKHKGEII